ncbi:MAG: hypothetical protein ACP5JG_19085 [Anaerolineae bacterium]
MRKVLIPCLCLVMSLLFAGSALAQTGDDAAGKVSAMPADPLAGAMTITTVEPGKVVNATPSTLSVYGSGFSADCVVRLVGYGLLDTILINATALTAQMPAGIPTGTYCVEISNGTQTVAFPNALSVTAPSPTAAPTTPPLPPKPGQPILTVRNFAVEPVRVKAGQEFVVTIEIYNNGSRAGENTMAVFPGGTFVPVGETGHMIWQLHINHTAVVSQKMRAPATMSSGVHQLNVALSANDWEGNHYDYPTTIPVEVVGASQPATPIGSPKVVIEDASTNPAALIPGESFTLTLRLANRGRRTALNVFLGSGSEDIVTPARGGDIVSIEEIGLDEVVTTTLGLILDDAVEGGRQKLLVTLDYGDYSGGQHTDQQGVGLMVNANLTTQPQLLLDTCRTAPDFLTPGDTFTLTLEVTNVGGSNAERLMLALGGEGGAHLAPFIPLNAGNVIFVPVVGAGETVTLVHQLVIDGSAETKAHSLPVALGYDDARGVRHSDVQRLSLMVRRRPQIQASFYQDPGVLSVGVATEISLEVLNVGMGVINVLDISAEGPGLTVQPAGLPYVGPLDAGGAAPVDLLVTPAERAAGTGASTELTVLLTYRDDLNQQQVITTTLQLEVPQDGPPAAGPPDAEAPNPAGSSSGGPAPRRVVGGGGTVPEDLPAALAPVKTWVRVVRGLLGFGS